jgi:undecaprenyl pyrophosphate phosphatase UppP
MKLFFNGMGMAFLLSGFAVVFLTDYVKLESFMLPFGIICLSLPSLLNMKKNRTLEE